MRTALLAVFAIVGVGLNAQSQLPRPENTSRHPLFTDAQAASGETVYRQSCAACHGAALTGASAPPLTGPRFAASWNDPRVTLDDLFFVLRTTMPPRATNALSASDHAAVFAYILKTNGYPAGATPLSADSAPLKLAHLEAASVPAARGPARSAPPAFIPAAPGAAPATSGPDQTTLNAAMRSTDWLLHSHDYSGTRFSPLQEINASNASRL